MSRFSGKQYRGAARVLKEIKREEAEARQKEFAKKNKKPEKSVEELMELAEQLDPTPANDNPGPALPGLAKRARKITRK